MATTAAAQLLVKEVQDNLFPFPSEYLLLLCDDELGFAQPTRGQTTRQLYAVYAGAVPELTVVPAMLQISDYLGVSKPKPATSNGRREKETPVSIYHFIPTNHVPALAHALDLCHARTSNLVPIGTKDTVVLYVIYKETHHWIQEC